MFSVPSVTGAPRVTVRAALIALPKSAIASMPLGGLAVVQFPGVPYVPLALTPHEGCKSMFPKMSAMLYDTRLAYQLAGPEDGTGWAASDRSYNPLVSNSAARNGVSDPVKPYGP